MRCRSLGVVLVLVVAGTALGFDAVGTLLKVDADKGVLHLRVKGKDRVVPLARDARILGTDDKPLPGGLRAPELKEGAEVTVTVERGGGPEILALRLGKREGVQAGGKASFGFKPLPEMTAEDRYKGEDGGLYGGGKNEPPEGHARAAKKASEQVVPRDADGKPSQDGRVVLISISMSNATQEFTVFKRMADGDADKAATLTIVDCAQGGQAMAEWVDPKAAPWGEADRRLARANVTAAQVQVAWIKLANKGPAGDLGEHGRKLYKDTLAVIQNAKARFPNLRLVYLSSRIYGGWSAGRLNPEPYAYEGAFAVRWLIQDQLQGDAALNHDADRGAVKAPVLLWGPYLWADGTTPRKSDGLVWERADLAGDGTHPSDSGRRKVAEMLLKFFRSDATARPWFAKDGRR